MAALKCMNTNFLKHIFNRLKALKKNQREIAFITTVCIHFNKDKAFITF